MLSQSVEEKEGNKTAVYHLSVGDHEGKLFIDEWD